MANKNRAALREPRQRALDNPAARLHAARCATLLSMANRLNASLVAVFETGVVAGRIVVAAIETQALWTTQRGLRTLHHDGVNCGRQELGIVHVGRGDDHAERSPVAIDDHAAFGAVFPAIRGIGADSVPPCRALPIAASAACQFQSTLANSSHSLISSAMICANTPPSTQR